VRRESIDLEAHASLDTGSSPVPQAMQLGMAAEHAVVIEQRMVPVEVPERPGDCVETCDAQVQIEGADPHSQPRAFEPCAPLLE